jgi:uncharacterized membrane protein
MPPAPPSQPLDYRPAWAEVAPLKWRRMALASWLCPGAWMLTRLLLEPMVRAKAISPIAVAGITGLFLLTGLTCGLRALWAVRVHGPRGLLLPALCGTVLCGFLLLIMAGALIGYLSGQTVPPPG